MAEAYERYEMYKTKKELMSYFKIINEKSTKKSDDPNDFATPQKSKKGSNDSEKKNGSGTSQ